MTHIVARVGKQGGALYQSTAGLMVVWDAFTLLCYNAGLSESLTSLP